ncbi:MAG: SIMPL domain-containing protein [Bacillota bacterium]
MEAKPVTLVVIAVCAAALLCTLIFVGRNNAEATEAALAIISVNGEAVVNIVPDQAVVQVGVTVEASTSEQAVSQHTQRMQALFDALKQQGVAETNIQTTRFTVDPIYRYERETGRSSIDGFRVSNMVKVTVTDLNKLGQLLGVATANGANVVHGVEFGLKDPRSIQDQALKEAVADARRKAEAMAQAAGVSIVRVKRITLSGGYNPPIVFRAMEGVKASAAEVPVEPGQIDVRASVSMELEIR